MSAKSNDRGRITARVTAYAQQAVEQAAELTATTTNQFVAQAALREAERIIEEHAIIRLTQRDAELFLHALDNPAELSAELASSLKQHLEARTHDAGGRTTILRWTPESR